MGHIEIILRITENCEKVTEHILVKFDCKEKYLTDGIDLGSSDIQIDLRGHQVLYKGKSLLFTEHEFLVLAYLASQPGRVFTKEQIYMAVWNDEPIDVGSAIFCTISNIRKKIRKYLNKEYIQTVWGVGYKFINNVSE